MASLQTIVDLEICTVTAERVLKYDRSRNSWNEVVKHSEERED